MVTMEARYTRELLQAFLNRLWEIAQKDRYVLAAPIKVLGGRNIVFSVGPDDITVGLTDVNRMYHVLEKLGVAQVHKYDTPGPTPLLICKVVKREVPSAKYDKLYATDKAAKLKERIRVLTEELEATKAELRSEKPSSEAEAGSNTSEDPS